MNQIDTLATAASTDAAVSLASTLGLQIDRLEERREMMNPLVCCVIVVL
jgi:hypothetical protein